mgnify:CR=1 FL=1
MEAIELVAGVGVLVEAFLGADTFLGLGLEADTFLATLDPVGFLTGGIFYTLVYYMLMLIFYFPMSV